MKQIDRAADLREMNANKKKLKDAGWEHILSVSHVPGENYGLLFTKNGEKFWLNKETKHKLPV